MIKKLSALLFVLTLIISVKADAYWAGRDAAFHEKYSLQKMTILSRHNIRSPLTAPGSDVEKVTPHKWFKWTSRPAELSLKGAQLETIMGQYFRRALTSEKLVAEVYKPKEGEMRFYANSKQRTIATARYFAAGFIPMADVTVEHKYEPEGSDLVFSPHLAYYSEGFKNKAEKEMQDMIKNRGIKNKLETAYKTLEKVIDYKDSPLAKSGKKFTANDMKIIIEKDKQPQVKGSFRLALSTVDALILQYYEEPHDKAATFGHTLTTKEWEQLGSVIDIYYDVTLKTTSVAPNVVHRFLGVMNDELSNKNRKFSFLCGHDSTIAATLAALDVKPYSLPNAIERQTPIGVKFVVSVWKDKNGEEYAAPELVYQSVNQLKNREILTEDNPPMVYRLKLNGLNENKDGLYRLEDVEGRFAQAIQYFDELKKL
ncbi:MAG: histidine-type phosphatase [Selenomonadaceae bacterium]|nr:histidine-type phosphatase [Selenomonadaceae bacterium]